VNLFRVALTNFERKPLLGNGAGTYWQLWARDRDIPTGANDAHNLYLGTASELGVVGLVLIVVALLAPLGAAVSARRSPLVPATFGLYVAWAAHTAVEFDWALVGVTACALLGGVAMVASARPDGAMNLRATRYAIAVPLLTLLTVSLLLLVSDSRLASAREALAHARFADAIDRSRHAVRWAPWSSEPWQLIGDAESFNHREDRARLAYLRALKRDTSSWLLWEDLRFVSSGPERIHAARQVQRLNPRL
jgi:hypothetical protein